MRWVVFFAVLLSCTVNRTHDAGVKMNHEDDLMDPFSDDIGAEEIQDNAGDELDLADTIARVQPRADQLMHFANMRKLKHKLLDAQAPFVRSNPVSIGKGSLGNQVEVQLGPYPTSGVTPVRGPLKQVAAWQGEDAETTPVTITIGAVSLPTLFDGTQYAQKNPYAVIQFGTRSSLLQMEVDIGRGCQFTVNASMVTVSLGEEGWVINPTTPEVPSLLSGMLSFHPTARTQNITRTVRSISASTPVTYIPLPAFAKSVVPLKGDNASVGLLQFLDNAAASVGSFLIPTTIQQVAPIQIPNGATTVAFVNNAAPTFNLVYSLIFNLGF